jgi:hypothetical protein
MRIDPEEVVLQGAELLKPLFAKYGFVQGPLTKGESSGGRFASAEFRKGDRRFEFHFRSSLGMVTYRLGSQSISHQEYMCSILGKPNMSRYPGFAGEPLEAFRNLRDDILDYCGEFLEGTTTTFIRRIENARTCWSHIPKLPD